VRLSSSSEATCSCGCVCRSIYKVKIEIGKKTTALLLDVRLFFFLCVFKSLFSKLTELAFFIGSGLSLFFFSRYLPKENHGLCMYSRSAYLNLFVY